MATFFLYVKISSLRSPFLPIISENVTLNFTLGCNEFKSTSVPLQSTSFNLWKILLQESPDSTAISQFTIPISFLPNRLHCCIKSWGTLLWSGIWKFVTLLSDSRALSVFVCSGIRNILVSAGSRGLEYRERIGGTRMAWGYYSLVCCYFLFLFLLISVHSLNFSSCASDFLFQSFSTNDVRTVEDAVTNETSFRISTVT